MERASLKEPMHTNSDTDVFNASVVERHDLTPELSIVRVQPDEGPVPEFLPGQYTLLGLPKDEETGWPKPKLLRRAYSIASAASERRYLEFYVVLVEGGRLSTRLWNVPEGGRLWMDHTVRGKFTLDDVHHGAELLMVATGTGVAPFMSMLRTTRGTGRWRRFVLVHGVRRVADLGYREELEQLASTDPTFTYVPVVSREGTASWDGPRGRVQQILVDGTLTRNTGIELDPKRINVYLCGNPAMIESVHEILDSRGFSTSLKGEPGGIHYEKYW